MKKRALNSLLFILLFFIFSCNNPGKANETYMEKLSMEWKNDSLNCNGTRTKEKLKEFAAFINGKEHKKELITRYLGNPKNGPENSQSETTLSIDYFYYVSPGCYSKERDNCYSCISYNPSKDSVIFDETQEICE